ncbi:protein-glutamate O-methyltransferase CheR [Candidatus Raskinella chloraquaticus]|uniref:Chemotaxis protein methyltransferase n=1 Tax=Candidatus Raskinella chloraquaticus TaxID=1951219 RepID=A0A1W9HVK9_9HYPH|nr:MAG: chemotaxis protein CheR [Proteobacteria bacterium SG_bin8]
MSHEFEFLRRFLKDRLGLVLTPDKQYLIESRLMPVARRHNLKGLSEIVLLLGKPGNDALAVEVTEAMTTNESFFFRDKVPFDHFQQVMLPALTPARQSQKRLRIWCAAASTGQEPYSLAMILNELAARYAGWRIEITGTDLSREVLEKAKAGVYTQFEVQRGLPVQLMLKYFEQNGDTWRLSQNIRSMVKYQTFNLLDSFSSMGQFDIIFCRNVLIYFDNDAKIDIMNRMAKQLAPDGFFVLGAAETVVGLSNAFKPMPDKRGLYIHNAPAANSAAPVRPLSLAAVR